VAEGKICSFSVMDAREVIDAKDCYVSSGFIESHLHVEGLHILPVHFFRAFLARGTTTIVTDLHEIANAGGLAGILWYLSLLRGLPLDIFVMAPSCVPSSSYELGSGAIGVAELKRLRKMDKVIGLGEVMDLEGVMGRKKEVLSKLALFDCQPIDGHAPGLVGDDLERYASVGIYSDHETARVDEGEEKLRRGMHLFLREGSVAKDLANLLPLIRPGNLSRLSLCSDDLSARDLFETGHLDRLLGLLVKAGVSLVDALGLVTVNPATYFNLNDRSALGVGRKADLVIFDNPKNLQIRTTIKNGKIVYRDGEFPVDQLASGAPQRPSAMNLRPISSKELQRAARGRRVRAIGVREGSIVTEDLTFDGRIEDGCLVADAEKDLAFAYVFDRYRADETYGFCFVHGFSIRGGAMGSTYAHDSHNLVVVGDNIEDIHRVIEALRACGGGMSACRDAECRCVAMPYYGIISDLDGRAFLEKERELDALVRRMGVRMKNPFFQMSFLSLPVIPHLRLTIRGLFHVPTSSFVPANSD
jgi:adenine deaminase